MNAIPRNILIGLSLGGLFTMGLLLALSTGPAAVMTYTLRFETVNDLATEQLSVQGEGVTFHPTLMLMGWESGAPHYIYFYMWPYDNPGEDTVDVGAVIDYWVQPTGEVWIEAANFDYAAKTLHLGTDVLPLDGKVAFTIQQVTS